MTVSQRTQDILIAFGQIALLPWEIGRETLQLMYTVDPAVFAVLGSQSPTSLRVYQGTGF